MTKNDEKWITSVSNTITLTRLFKLIGQSFVFSFIITELTFIYFIEGGIYSFPSNLIFFLVILSLVLIIESFFFSPEVLLLTSSASVVTTITLVNFIFGTSSNPSTLPLGNDIFADYLYGLLGSLAWVVIIAFFIDLVKKRNIKRLHIIVLSSVTVAFAIGCLLFFYSGLIVNLFDTHPWIVAVLVAISSAIIGILIDRRRKR